MRQGEEKGGRIETELIKYFFISICNHADYNSNSITNIESRGRSRRPRAFEKLYGIPEREVNE